MGVYTSGEACIRSNHGCGIERQCCAHRVGVSRQLYINPPTYKKPRSVPCTLANRYIFLQASIFINRVVV